MKSATAVLAMMCLCLIATGCQQPKVVTDGSLVSYNGLEMSIQTPPQSFRVGDRFDVCITVRSVCPQPITIQARSGAPVYLHLMRSTALGEEEFKTFPEAQPMVMTEWTICPGQTRTFVMTLTVGADWPRGENLKLVAELNGFKGLCPWKCIYVVTQPRMS